MYNSRFNIFNVIISLQVNMMHRAPGVYDQWKRPTISDKIWYSNIVQTISPPEPLCCGKRTRIAGTFKFKKQLNEL